MRGSSISYYTRHEKFWRDIQTICANKLMKKEQARSWKRNIFTLILVDLLVNHAYARKLSKFKEIWRVVASVIEQVSFEVHTHPYRQCHHAIKHIIKFILVKSLLTVTICTSTYVTIILWSQTFSEKVALLFSLYAILFVEGRTRANIITLSSQTVRTR